mgnify:CR=1 FL=1
MVHLYCSIHFNIQIMTTSTIIKLAGLAIITSTLIHIITHELYAPSIPIKKHIVFDKTTDLKRPQGQLTQQTNALEIEEYYPELPLVYDLVVVAETIEDKKEIRQDIEPLYIPDACGCNPFYREPIRIEELAEYIPEPIDTLWSEQELIDPYIFESKVYPNPTINEATVEINIDNEDAFIIEIFNMNGQLIKQLHNGVLDHGRQAFNIELYDYPTGLYIIQIASSSQTETLKLQKTQ